MASVASQLIEEVTADAQSDSLEDVRKICADGTYFPNNLRMSYISGNKKRFNIFVVFSRLHFTRFYIKCAVKKIQPSRFPSN